MKKRLIIALVIIELILIIANIFRFNRTESYEYTSDDLYVAYEDVNSNETVYESGCYADHSNIEGSYVVTDMLNLGKGIYTISVNYSSNASGDWHTCYTTLESEYDTSDENTANLVNSDHIAIYSGDKTATYRAWVRYGSAFRVRTGPETDSTGDDMYVMVNSITVTYMRMQTIAHETVKLLFVLLIINLAIYLYLRKRTELIKFIKDKEMIIAGLLFIVVFASYPLAYRKIYFGDDIFYHLRRIAYLAEGLTTGQFPVHIYPGWDNGYGYAAGVGYGDLLLYPSAILFSLGFSLQFAYKCYIFLTNVLTAFISYYSFKRISGKDKIGLFCSALFTLMGFRLHSIYTGATVGEYGAYTFLPLVLLGLWDIYNRNHKRGEITLAIGVTLTLSCHVLSTFILALVIPLCCLILFERTIKKEVLIPLLKALGLIVLLNLHFLVPLIDYMLFQGMAGNAINSMLWGRGVEFVELFTYVADANEVTAGFLGLGFMAIVIICLAAGFILSGRFAGRTSIYIRLFVLNILLIFLSCNSMFYYWTMDNIPLLYKLLANMQFPWHFLDVSSVMIVFWASLVFGNMSSDNYRNSLPVAIAVTCTLCLVQSGSFLGVVVAESNTITMFDDTAISGNFAAEFSIDGADVSLTETETDMVVRDTSLGVETYVTDKSGCNITAYVNNPTEETVTIEAPLWGYRYYKATADGKRLTTSMAESKKLAIEIPAGFSGEIKIYYSEPVHWRLSELLSLATLLYILGAFRFIKGKSLKKIFT